MPDVRNARNRTQLKQKTLNYLETLKLQSAINRKQEVANLELAQSKKLGISPIVQPKPYASSEEALADSAKQNETALIHLRELLPYGSDATSALFRLQGEVNSFNRHWNAFKSDVSGQVNLNPALLQELWDRFKVKLARTANTGITIALDDTRFNERLRGVGRAVAKMVNQLKDGNQITRDEARKLDASIQTFVENRNVEQLEAVEKAIEDGNIALIASFASGAPAPTTTGAPAPTPAPKTTAPSTPGGVLSRVIGAVRGTITPGGATGGAKPPGGKKTPAKRLTFPPANPPAPTNFTRDMLMKMTKEEKRVTLTQVLDDMGRDTDDPLPEANGKELMKGTSYVPENRNGLTSADLVNAILAIQVSLGGPDGEQQLVSTGQMPARKSGRLSTKPTKLAVTPMQEYDNASYKKQREVLKDLLEREVGFKDGDDLGTHVPTLAGKLLTDISGKYVASGPNSLDINQRRSLFVRILANRGGRQKGVGSGGGGGGGGGGAPAPAPAPGPPPAPAPAPAPGPPPAPAPGTTGGGGLKHKKAKGGGTLKRKAKGSATKKKVTSKAAAKKESVETKVKRMFKGGGIARNTQVRWVEFGKYILHMPSLKGGSLNLRYPSMGTTTHQRTQHISEPLQEFLEDLVERQHINHRLYNDLSKDDKKLFDTVAQKAQIDETLGVKVDNTEKKEELRRFEILRGEICAGNDAPQILKELRQYVLRFLHDGTISKSEGNQLLLELAACQP